MENKKLYKWVCTCDDNEFEESTHTFSSQEEAYEDMRKSAINKIFWNTEWFDVTTDTETTTNEDGMVCTSGRLDINGNPMEDNWGIAYKIHFHPQMIQHHSYSGLYTYKIVISEG